MSSLPQAGFQPVTHPLCAAAREAHNLSVNAFATMIAQHGAPATNAARIEADAPSPHDSKDERAHEAPFGMVGEGARLENRAPRIA